jgi:FtsZ-binding cell division protein ZapB
MGNPDVMERQRTEELEALERLEQKVERAAQVIAALGAERDELRAGIQVRETRIRELEEEEGSLGAEAAQWEKERAGFLRERATVMRRIEAILQRLEELGIE